jgi:hypothetical protein
MDDDFDPLQAPPTDDMPPPPDGDFDNESGRYFVDEGIHYANSRSSFLNHLSSACPHTPGDHPPPPQFDRVESPVAPPLPPGTMATGRTASILLPPPPPADDDEPPIIPKLRQMSSTPIRLSPNDLNVATHAHAQRRSFAINAERTSRSPAVASPQAASDEPLAGARSASAAGRVKAGTPTSVAPHGGGPFDVDNISLSSGNSSVFAERAKTLASPGHSRTDSIQKTKLVSGCVEKFFTLFNEGLL